MTSEMEKALTPKDIVLILRACGDAQVTVLQFGDLYVEFSRKEDSQAPEPRSGDPVPTAVEPRTPVPATEIAAKKQKDAFARDEQALKEDELAELWITDPEQAEKLVAAGELDEESTDGSEEDA